MKIWFISKSFNGNCKIMLPLRLCFVLSFVFFGVLALAKPLHPFPLNITKIRQLKKQGGTLVSDRVGGYIMRANALATNKKYDSAIEILEYHYNKKSLNKLEKAHFALNLGRLYRQNKDSKKSMLYLQKALNSKALPYQQHLSALYFIAQVHMEDENYTKALDLLKFWFSINDTPSPQSYVLLAQCYYVKGQLKKALKYIEQVILLVGRPMESWLQFAVAIHLKQKNYKKALPHLERLVALYPSRASNWKQLAGVYLYLNKTNHAFVTLDMANKMRLLKSKSDYLNLSSLYIEQGLPYQGAQLLRSKINQKLVPREQKHLELLAEAFWLAREGKSSLMYLKEASQHAVRPVFFIQYGQKLLDQELWKDAEKIFKKALNTKQMQNTIQEIKEHKKHLALIYKKENQLKQQELFQPQSTLTASDSPKETSIQSKSSSLKAPSTNLLEGVYLGIGIALYQQEQYEKALFYFRKSIEVNDTFLSGYQWIDYTETSIADKQNKETAKKSLTKSPAQRS